MICQILEYEQDSNHYILKLDYPIPAESYIETGNGVYRISRVDGNRVFLSSKEKIILGKEVFYFSPDLKFPTILDPETFFPILNPNIDGKKVLVPYYSQSFLEFTVSQKKPPQRKLSRSMVK